MEDDNSYISENYNDNNWDILNVPGYWNNKVKERYGYCWLRMKIRNNPVKNLGLFLKNANTAYKLYINGELSMYNGNPGNSKIDNLAKTYSLFTYLPKTENITIAWKISNFEINNGGPMCAPIIDTITNTIYSFWLTKVQEAIIIGIILTIALYNLI